MDVASNVAPDAGAGAQPDITVITPAKEENYSSVSSAARALANARHKMREDQQAAAQPNAAAANSELAPEANADPQPEAPGEQETTEQQPEPEQPPIEPPRSWTKEEKERFKSFPRETQEYLATREQDRDRSVRQRQNELADKEKQLTERLSAAEQIRTQYEQSLPLLLQTLQQSQAGEFHDIKTIADVEKMAREDWPRYVLWDAQQKKIAAVAQELRGAQDRQSAEKTQKWQTFAKEQDALFYEKAPDLANPDVAAKTTKEAGKYLADLGFTEKEIVSSWNGEGDLSLRDHRVQLLIRDGLKYREAQTKAKAAVQKPVPQVQRPGVAQPRGADQAARIQALNSKLEQSGSLKDAAELLRARRAAAR